MTESSERPAQEERLASLPPLRGAAAGKRDAVVVVITGNHCSDTPAEIARMIGDECAQRRVINHGCEDDGGLTPISAPGVDIPIRINTHVARASVRILTGLIAPHQAAGYGGGRKSLTPGVAAGSRSSGDFLANAFQSSYRELALDYGAAILRGASCRRP